MSTLQDVPLESIGGEPRKLPRLPGQGAAHRERRLEVRPDAAVRRARERSIERFENRGFAVLGFPANEFLAQEPGTNAEIADFCRTSYDVTFPMFSKIKVSGPDRHPLYTELVRAEPKAQGAAADFRKKSRRSRHRCESRTGSAVELREIHRRTRRCRDRTLCAEHRAQRPGTGVRVGEGVGTLISHLL